MLRLVIVFLTTNILAKAQNVAPDFEECYSRECQSDLTENSNDMYLIQKKLEVGLESLDASEEEEAEKEEKEDEDEDYVDTSGPLTRMKMAHYKLHRAAASLLARDDPTVTTKKHDKGGDDKDKDKDKDEKKDKDKGEGKEGEGKGEDETSGTNETDLWEWTWAPIGWSEMGVDSNHSLGANMFHDWDVYTVTHIYTWIIWVILAILVWHLCFPGEPEIFRSEDPARVFAAKPFDCMSTPRICLCSFCCPAVQWSDTMHLAGFMKVWIALPIFFLAALLNGLVYGSIVWGAFTSILIVHYRQHLRSKLGLKSWTCGSCFVDCCYVCWCPFCAIAQEAQVTRYAYLQNQRAYSAYPVQSGSGHIIYSGDRLPSRGRIPSRERVVYSASQPRVATGVSVQVPTPGSVVYTNSQGSLPGRSSRSPVTVIRT